MWLALSNREGTHNENGFWRHSQFSGRITGARSTPAHSSQWMALLSLVGSSLGKELHPEKELGRPSLPKNLLSFEKLMRRVRPNILAVLEVMLTLYRGKHFRGYVKRRGHDHLTH